MTRKSKILIYILIIIILLVKEEIYGFLIQTSSFNKQTSFLCNIENETLKNKYNELMSAYGYIDSIPYHLEYTKVLFQDIYNLNNQITIYKGEKNNIQENNVVINEQGLVGIISKVNKNSSVVDLLLNKNLNLSVKINDNYGILKYKNNELVVEGINNRGIIHESDQVLMSDISIYPENILIGYVKEITYDTYEIEKNIKITPAVDFTNLKYLSIITDLRGVE